MAVENRYSEPADPDAMRRRLAIAISTVLAGAVLWIFADLYLWAKILHVPTWMDAWMPASLAGGAALFASLLPAALVPRTPGGAAKAIVAAAGLAPLSAVLVYASRYSGDALLVNATFQYFWVLAWACVIPASLLLGLRLLSQRFET